MRSTIGGPDSLGGADADRVEPHHHQTAKRILFRRTAATAAVLHAHAPGGHNNMGTAATAAARKDQGVGPGPKVGVAGMQQDGSGAGGGGSNNSGRGKSEPAQYYSDGGGYK